MYHFIARLATPHLSLTWRFAVAALATIALVGYVLTRLLGQVIADNALESSRAEVRDTLAPRIVNQLSPDDLEAPITGQRLADFQHFVEGSVISERTARIKIWNTEGRVIYAEDPDLVGRLFPMNDEREAAFAGETVSELAHPSEAEDANEGDYGDLLEVYTPIVLPGSQEVVGAFEIYQVYGPVAQQIAETRRYVILGLGGGLAVLYLTLLAIVHGGTRTIDRQHRDLDRENTERKRAEQAVAQHAAELARSNAELEQLAYVASHDLQEPLRMVASYTQLLARRYKGKLDSDANEFIAYAVDGVTRMQRLISDLLTYSRVGSQGKDFEPTDCENVLDRALTNLEGAIGESGAVVTHDLLPTVAADEVQLGQLFENLIGNAIKFHGEEPPRVHVSAEQQEAHWVFHVRDNGNGLDPQYTQRIFIMFQRLHGREEYRGTGIGLAICKKIVQRHSGRIWVESEPGKGATFRFTIPARAESRLAA